MSHAMDHQFREPCAACWVSYMRCGAFEAAWTISDAVLRARAGVPCWHWPWHLQYIWDGTSLAGKRVLVRCYHGLGDTIQFVRYAPLIKEIAREVMVWAQPALLPLLRTMRGIDRLLPLRDGTPEVEYDVDVESMELPHIMLSGSDDVIEAAHIIRALDPVISVDTMPAHLECPGAWEPVIARVVAELRRGF